MTITANIEAELEDITRAEQPLRALEATLEAELKDAECQRPTPTNHNRPAAIRETLRQLRRGVSLSVEGVDARLWDVLSSEPVRRFKFRAPGLAPLLRLRTRLLAEQEVLLHPTPAPVLFAWRYTGKPWGKVAGQRRQTGDVLQLTEEQSALWASVLEPVGRVEAGGGEGPNPTQQPAGPPTGSGVSN